MSNTGETTVELKLSEETVTERPAVSNEEYNELRNLQGQQIGLQAQGYQAFTALKSLRQQFDDLTASYNTQKSEMEAAVEKIESDLKSATDTFQVRFREVTKKYGFDGVEQINIEETEPHYISNAPRPGPPAG